MADLSKLILPVKDATTGEISNQEFDLTGGGGGTGDMQKSVYDSTDAVADAGGIPSYVSDQISDGTLTIQKNGTAVATFSANQSTNATANITVPVKVSELQNDSGYTTNTGTVTSVTTGTGLTGGPVTTSGTISLESGVVTAGSAGPTAAVTGDEGTTVAIPRITVDTYGRVTGLTSYNLTNKNTTYSSKAAASGGTDTSLVTTGEKYTWDNKSTVTIGTTGTASSTAVSYQRVGINGSYTAIKGTMYMLISNTSSTSYSFTNSNITTSSSIDVYTDTYGDNPSNVTISGNTCTVTFSAAKTRSVKIYIQ